MRKQYRILSAVFLSITALLIITACSDDSENFQNLNMNNAPDEQSDSVHVVAMNGDKLEYILDAKHYSRYHKKKKVLADTIRVQTFDENGVEESVLTAEHADVDENRDIMIARRNVKIVADSGTLFCNYLQWDRKTDRIYARGKVVLQRGQNTINGYELKTDINLFKIEMVKVSAQGKVNEENVDF